MEGGEEFVDLPQSVRQIAVSSRFDERDAGNAGGAGEGFAGVLSPFGGMLLIGVTTGEWPPPALSHLVLGSLVTETLTESGSTGQPSAGEPEVAMETPQASTETPENGDDEPELLVRDLVRSDADRSASEELDPDADRPGSDPESSLTVRTVTDMETPSGPTASSPGRSTITTDRRSVPVAGRQEGPELTVARQPPAVTRPASGTPDPPPSTIERPQRAPDQPSQDPVTATRSSDDDPGIGASVEETDTAGRDAQSGAETAVVDTEVVTPPQRDRRPRVNSESGTWPSSERPDRETVDSPRMAVRCDSDATDTADSAAGRDGDTTTPRESADSPVAPTSATRGRADQPNRIDDLVDVERLADRLSRVFERRSRIERERRGR
jgi:hypothetical protein